MANTLFDSIAECARECGVHVYRGPVLNPDGPRSVGRVDGLTVAVSPHLNEDQAAWLAAHLFGHAAQWADAVHQRRLAAHLCAAEGARLLHDGILDREWDLRKTPSASTLAEIARYERAAGCFALFVLPSAMGEWYWCGAQRDWRAYRAWLVGRGWADSGAESLEAGEPRRLCTYPRTFEPGYAFDV